MTAIESSTSSSDSAGRFAAGPVLPELRPNTWEDGSRVRANTGALTLLAGLPRLVAQAVGVSWRADRVRTGVVVGAALGGGFLATCGLLATQRVLIELFSSGPTPDRIRSALPALGLLAVATGLRALLTIVTGYAENGLTPRVTREVERSLFEVTTSVRLEAFDQDAFADDVERGIRGTEAVVRLVEAALDLLAALFGLVAVAVAVAVIHPLLLVALLVATLPRVWASLRAGRMRYLTFVASSVRRRRLQLLHGLMAERAAAAELRSYGLRTFLLGQYDHVMGAETRIQLRLARRITTALTVGSITGGLATTAVYVLLGVLLLDGQIPLSAAATCVVALQAAARTLTVAIYQVDRVYIDGQHFGQYTAFLHRAAEHLPTPVTTPPSAAAFGPLVELTVDRVSLCYPGRSTPALDEVSLTIHAGQTVAFVGENGSGKSTLAAVIEGLRAPTSGRVLWNGQPHPGRHGDRPGPAVTVVTQDFYKWPFTAATNIYLGDTGSTPEQARLEAAAHRAVAHDMVTALPHGYETLLDRTFTNGQELSGGQWQRLTAARGFYGSGDLLIMDEPSSALDPRAEDALFQAIRDRQGVATTILITHRLANVRHVDQIFVLHHGTLIEAGTHEELMRADGHYAELFTLQAAGYTNPTPT